MGKREFQAHGLNEQPEISAMSLIMATHAAPAVQGVTRVGLGTILELIVNARVACGWVISQCERASEDENALHPPTLTQAHRQTGITTCLRALASGSCVVRNYGKGKKTFMGFFFLSLLIDASAAGSCSVWEKLYAMQC